MIVELLKQIDTFTGQTVAEGVGHMISYTTPLMGTFVLLYGVYKGFQYLFSPPDVPIIDVLKFHISLVAVASIALNANYYINSIVPIVTGTGDELVKWFGGQNMANSLGDLLLTLGTLLIEIWNNASGVAQSLFALFSMGLLLIFGLPFVMTAITIIVIAKIYLAIIAILGVIYICFLFFPVTRNMFFSWLSQFIGYSLIFLALSLVMGMMIKFVNDVVLKSLTENYTNLFIQICSCVVIFRVFNAVLDNLTGFIQSLAGGGGISTGQTTVLGGTAARNMANMMGRSAAKMAGGKLAGAGSKASQGMKNMARAALNKLMNVGNIKGG